MAVHLIPSIFSLSLAIAFYFVSSTSNSQVYIVYLGANNLKDPVLTTSYHNQILSRVFSRKEDYKQSLLYSYNHGFSGFSAKLNSTQAASLAKMKKVITVFKSKSLKLHTTRSWDFMGLNLQTYGQGAPYQIAYGSDTIVGLFDTGVWPESESFKEAPNAEPIPSSWKGKCVHGDSFDPSKLCNRKLIGARFYLKGFEASYGPLNTTRNPEYRSPRDFLGHGTHTASTAVGSIVPNAAGFFGLGRGTARGGAPAARLAVYKTCWGKNSDGICTEADILAAFDDALRDGVHVMSASFGSPPPLPQFFASSADIGSFHAALRGVSVVFSAGNDGPDPGLVQNVAPWALSVAASTVDRRFPTEIVLDHNLTLMGESLITEEINGQLADATMYFYGGVCTLKNWMKIRATGNIILCFSTLGPIQFVEIAQEAAKRANASGLVFVQSLTKQIAEIDIFPTVRVDIFLGTSIRNYLAYSPRMPMVKIGPSRTVIGKSTAPSVAYFSSRGPNSVLRGILKPDVTAPGIGILAAWPPKTPPASLPGDDRSVNWNFQSGTSMSCPHVAGVAALLRSAHPDWSPAAIRSALMTTAYTRDTSGDRILSGGSTKSSNPFDIGTGHIDPLKAMDPGLVYDAKTSDYVLLLCNIGYTNQQIQSMLRPRTETKPITCPSSHTHRTDSNFNYPSITIPNLWFHRTVKRTVRNVGQKKTAVYFVNVAEPEGVEIVVWPRILVFSRSEAENTYYVTFIPKRISSGRYEFGEIIWTDGVHNVRSPLVVFVSNAGSVRYGF